MLKTLLKKQMLELNRSFFYDQKKNRSRSKVSSILFIALYALLMVGIVGGMFAYLSFNLCTPLVAAGMGWLYFVIFSLIAIALGVFGSVFNTFSGLYQAKDNDLLLSMPIPVRYILISRLIGVYLMGLMFSAVVILPAVIVYFISVPLTASAVIGSIVLILLLSIVVLILSCVLGWVVAKISAKLKNKSFITVIISLAFLAAYYFVYFKASTLLQTLIANAVTVGAKIKGTAYPLYLLGRVGEGDGLAICMMTVAVLALFALTCYILSRSFLKIATSTGNVAKAKYKETAVKTKGIFAALLGKEFGRFTSSPNYMLNCGLSTLLLPIGAVLLLIKGVWLKTLLWDVFGDMEFAGVLLTAAICMLASMNDMTAPSISLEGKSLWLAQSLPVTAWQVLQAKLSVQLLLTGIPVLLCGICAVIVMQPSPVTGIFMVLFPLLYVVLTAGFGLFINLKRPDLNWTNEIAPIKQSLGVMLALFGGWGYAVIFIAGFLIGGNKIGAVWYLSISAGVTAIFAAVLYRWLKCSGTKVFAGL